jgi:hypothetical protein
MRSPFVIIGGLPDARLGVRRVADLAHRHVAECAHQTLLPFGRQRLPDRTGYPLAHRVIQASAPTRTALGGRVSGIRRILSNYQRCLVWCIEGALAEFKSHLRDARMVLRSETPAAVRQEVWGLLLAHFAVRGLMHEAALQANEDPDRLSFVHTVRVIRRHLPLFAAFPPSAACRPAPPGAGRNPGRAHAKQPWPAEPARRPTHAERPSGAAPFSQSNHQDNECREHTGA